MRKLYCILDPFQEQTKGAVMHFRSYEVTLLQHYNTFTIWNLVFLRLLVIARRTDNCQTIVHMYVDKIVTKIIPPRLLSTGQ